MASFVLVLLMGGVTLLATKELVESRVRGRVETVRENHPRLETFRSKPKGTQDVVKDANSGNNSLGIGVPRLKGVLGTGVNGLPLLKLTNPVSGVESGQVYFLPEMFR